MKSRQAESVDMARMVCFVRMAVSVFY
jgi:hypothetical protein